MLNLLGLSLLTSFAVPQTTAVRRPWFYNIMKQNACFEGDDFSCLNLLITHSKFSFRRTNSFEIGLSDHHPGLKDAFLWKAV